MFMMTRKSWNDILRTGAEAETTLSEYHSSAGGEYLMFQGPISLEEDYCEAIRTV